MKTLLGMALSLSVSSVAFALDSPCVTKQKNAASFEVAQKLGVSVQGVEVLSFDHGAWTEAMGSNVGSDDVTVRTGNRTNRGMTIQTYTVSAKQIGMSDDCTVTRVTAQ